MKKYRVWHIPQIPGRAFRIELLDLDEAVRLSAILADYDLFQYKEKIKPDFSNAGGVEEWDDEDEEWYDMDEDDYRIKMVKWWDEQMNSKV